MCEYGCVCVLHIALGAGSDNLNSCFSSILLHYLVCILVPISFIVYSDWSLFLTMCQTFMEPCIIYEVLPV